MTLECLLSNPLRKKNLSNNLFLSNEKSSYLTRIIIPPLLKLLQYFKGSLQEETFIEFNHFGNMPDFDQDCNIFHRPPKKLTALGLIGDI